ncbi:hypothetical protein RRG08_043089 [Elysia crispata]|uniref:Uncharacterized protein n=1 Tax=Elysia crispata TaxID=231223 RepID=A0AAE0XY21_9GAST|nr:hypothetical protein RRG08_043089 [Elysia crispata]
MASGERTVKGNGITVQSPVSLPGRNAVSLSVLPPKGIQWCHGSSSNRTECDAISFQFERKEASVVGRTLSSGPKAAPIGQIFLHESLTSKHRAKSSELDGQTSGVFGHVRSSLGADQLSTFCLLTLALVLSCDGRYGRPASGDQRLMQPLRKDAAERREHTHQV